MENLKKVYKALTESEAEKLGMKRENANINVDTAMGLMLKFGSEGAKAYSLDELVSKGYGEAHKEGYIHIHDLDFMPTGTLTCCQIPLDKLFEGGFSTGHGFVREPQDIMSYSSLACIAIQSNQNEQHGGQSIPLFDRYLAQGVGKTFITKYVEVLEDRYDLSEEVCEKIKEELKKHLKETGTILSDEGKDYVKTVTLLTVPSLRVDAPPTFKTAIFDKLWERAYKKAERQTFQAMEGLIHNLNTMHSRAGSQVPFSSINYGLDTREEARILMKQLLLATEKGLGGGETPIFPIQVFQVKEGVNYNSTDINYDIFKLAMRVSAKRLFPNFVFVDAPFNLKHYNPERPETAVATMGCRTRVLGNVYDPSNEVSVGRGNLSFTSINLPRLAIESKGDIGVFYEKLDSYLILVKDQLLERMAYQSKKKVFNFPFLMGEGVWLNSENLEKTETLEEVIKQGTLGIGFIGLAECLKALIGKHHGESEEAQKLGLEIIGRMKEYTDKISEELKLNFAVIGTPAEGLSDRFLKIDRAKYGVIEGVTDKDFYTNSNHIPVNYEISAYDKVIKEAPYHALTSGGHITYIELDGDPLKNLDAYEAVVRHMKQSGIGYGAINHPVDRCPECLYVGVIDNECPKCGVKEGEVKFDRIRRITGYLVGTLDRWGDGKRAEEKKRVKHGVSSI